MSAWIVDKRHIDALLTAALSGKYSRGCFRWYTPEAEQIHLKDHFVDYTNADEIGQMLLNENVASVSYRYGDSAPEDLPGRVDLEWLEPYTFHRKELPPVAILKAISCYEYQTCEHEAWRHPANVARAFCEALRKEMITMLPGYEEAAWGVE